MLINKYAEKPTKVDGPDEEVPLLVEESLAAFVRKQWNEAVLYKQSSGTSSKSTTERLLACERQVRGEYDPAKLDEIRRTGGSELYLMLTDVKTRAAQAWIADVLNSAGERLFDLEVSSSPDMPKELKSGIVDIVKREAQEVAESGQIIHPEAFRARMEQVHEEILQRLKQEGEDAARRMSGTIQDQMNEGKFTAALRDFINDFTTYPSAILKGPVKRRKKKLTWGANFKPVIKSIVSRDFNRVSPYDIFPSRNSSGPNDGYICERHKLDATKLEDMRGTSGYSDANIEQVLELYGMSGTRSYLLGDNEHNRLEGKGSMLTEDGHIEAIEYWGPVPGRLLHQWGLRRADIKEDMTYECNVWLVGHLCIRAVINPHPLGHRPYRVSCFERIPGSFWGKAIPELMADVQAMANAASRALANNLGLASGPQVEVTVDRLAAGEKITNMYPWKIYQTTSDKTGGGQRAVNFFQPDMHANELLGIVQQFMKYADEVTGIPNYIYGSGNVAGAGRTASGLSMLMDNAAKGIKQAIANIDHDVLAPTASDLYIDNMMYSEDQFIKGDFKIVTRGAIGIMHKEQIQLRRQEFLQSTANPIDMQIMGNDGRAYILREVARGLEMDTNKIVPSDDVLQAQQKQLEQMQAMQAMGAPPQPGAAPEGAAPVGLTPPSQMPGPSAAPPGALPPTM